MSGTGQNKDDRAEGMILVVEAGREGSQTSEFLREAGFQIKAAADGLKAFEEIRDMIPDVIIVDSPKAEEGIEVCRRLKENMAGREIPLLFIAAQDDRAHVSAALQAGAMDFLVKPIER